MNYPLTLSISDSWIISFRKRRSLIGLTHLMMIAFALWTLIGIRQEWVIGIIPES